MISNGILKWINVGIIEFYIWLCCLFVFKLDVGLSVEFDVGEFVLFNVFVVLISVVVVIIEKFSFNVNGINKVVIIGIVENELLMFIVISNLISKINVVVSGLFFFIRLVVELIREVILFVVCIIEVNFCVEIIIKLIIVIIVMFLLKILLFCFYLIILNKLKIIILISLFNIIELLIFWVINE